MAAIIIIIIIMESDLVAPRRTEILPLKTLQADWRIVYGHRLPCREADTRHYYHHNKNGADPVPYHPEYHRRAEIDGLTTCTMELLVE